VTAFLRYFVVGSSALGLHLAVIWALLRADLCEAWVASVIGFVAACAFNYTAQRLWVFRSRRSHAAALPRYAAITTVMLGVNTALFSALYALGLPPLASQTLTTGAVFVLNFVANRHITFASARV
jgi:putative flippase GtrA